MVSLTKWPFRKAGRSQWKLEYDIKDHLGNTRVSFREGVGGAELKAKTDFDPWGVRLNGTGTVNSFQNRFELQGHEKESTFNLNRIIFGARVYNPTIGRFDRIDPLADLDLHLSSYSYVGNSPLRYVDLFGMKRRKVPGQEDTYLETEPFDEVVVIGFRDSFNAAFGFDAYYRYLENHSQDESYIKVKRSFREGGNMAAGIIAAPIAAIGAVELGVGGAVAAGVSRLGVFRTLSFGRNAIRVAMAKGAFNLGGQTVSNALISNLKLDLTGLGLDMIMPNHISALGGFGEVGIDFKKMEFYGEFNPNMQGALKTSLGYGVGSIGGNFQNMITANGFSTAMSALGEAILKVYNSAANAMIDKLPINSTNDK